MAHFIMTSSSSFVCTAQQHRASKHISPSEVAKSRSAATTDVSQQHKSNADTLGGGGGPSCPCKLNPMQSKRKSREGEDSEPRTGGEDADGQQEEGGEEEDEDDDDEDDDDEEEEDDDDDEDDEDEDDGKEALESTERIEPQTIHVGAPESAPVHPALFTHCQYFYLGAGRWQVYVQMWFVEDRLKREVGSYHHHHQSVVMAL